MTKPRIAALRGLGAGSPVAVELGRRIRLARRARDLTQGQLGQPLTKSYISAIERGRTLPSLGALFLLAARLGTNVEDLLSGVNGGSTADYTGGHGSPPETTPGGG